MSIYYVVPDIEVSQLDAYETQEDAEEAAKRSYGIVHILKLEEEEEVCFDCSATLERDEG